MSLSQADLVKTKDGQSYQGTVEYCDADTIKFKLADSGGVRVFPVKDVEEVQVDSQAVPPAPPKNPQPPHYLTAEYWNQQGYADGSRTVGLRSAAAGLGGCIGAPVGGYAGAAVGAASDPYGSQAVACCLLGAVAGGVVGSVGGSTLGSLGQQEAINPALDSVCQSAYRRGYQRGARNADNVALWYGAGGAVLSVGVLCLYGYLIIRSMSW